MINLANVYLKQESNDKAVTLLEEALRRRRETFGDDHARTQDVRVNLSALYINQEKYDLAESLILGTIAAYEREGDQIRPAVLLQTYNLAAVYERQKRWDEARPMYSHALEIARRTNQERGWRLISSARRQRGSALSNCSVAV